MTRPAELPEYPDFHTHILPGIDDGSRSCAESASMLRQMKEQRVGFLAATPHYYANLQSPEEFLAARDAAWETLRREPDCDGLEIRLGAEVLYYEGISRLEHPERLCLQGSDLLLLELPFHPWSDRLLSEVRLLSEETSPRIVIAHVDRYFPFQSRRSMQMLLEMDVLFQCNAEFFLTLRTRRTALRMLKEGTIHFIGSDCHRAETRTPNLGPAMDTIRERAGEAVLRGFLSREAALLEDGGHRF